MNRLMKGRALAVLLAVSAGFTASCESGAPTGPAPDPTFSLSGTVFDNASVPISGAVVAIVGGTDSTLTDGSGRYELRGLPGGTTSVHASKEGYVPSTRNIDLPGNSPANFVLDFTGPSFNLAGNYTVTFTAAATCTQLPEFTRTRTYSASVELVLPNRYAFRLHGASFHNNLFEASVAGRSASFSTFPDGYEAVVHERLDDLRSVWIDFSALAYGVDAPTISVPMSGDYAFCPDNHPVHRDRCLVPRVTCTSSNHTFTLTRR